MLCHFAYEFVDKRRQTRKLGSYCCVAYILYLCAEAVDCFKHGCALAVCGVDLSGTVFAKNYTTIENWLTGSKESNSINQKVTFQSDEILALKTLDGLNAGIPLDFVAIDIVVNVRDTEHPTIGAYEFVVAELPAMESGYPVL